MSHTVRPARLGVLVVGLALLVSMWSPLRAEAATFPTPTGLQVVPEKTTSTSIYVDWNAVSGASGYRVRYANNSSMTGATTVSFRYSSGNVRNLEPNTRYWFRVAVASELGTGTTQSGYTPAPYVSGWTKVATAAPVPGSYDLDVASFNISVILGDSSSGHEAWSARRAKVAKELLGQEPADQPGPSPDVIALQEADTSRKFADGVTTQYTDLVHALNSYATGTDHYSAIAGTAAATHLVYNDATLSLVRGEALKWDAQESVVDGPRYMFWGIFETRATGDRFFFASNHLETASETVRRQQWQQLIRDVPTMAGELPIVLGGDFNSPRKATNPTAGVMLPQMYDAGFGDVLGQNGPEMVHVEGNRTREIVRGNIFSLNRWSRNMNHYPSTNDIGQSIDYLFATNRLVVKRWQMVVDDAKDYSLDGTVPSDHNLIKATIRLP